MTRSLRARLMIGTGLTAAVLTGAASVSLYLLMRSMLYTEFDQLLAAKARALAALVEQENGEIDVEFVERPLAEFERAERPEYFELWLEDGRVLARSRRLDQGHLVRVSGTPGDPQFRWVHLPDGRRGRLAGFAFRPAPAGGEKQAAHGVTLVVARETASVDATLAKLAGILAAVGCTTTLLILVALAWVIDRSLIPVARLAGDIESIDEDQLDARIDPEEMPDELVPVVKRLNDLLARLDAAFHREKSFTADAAHELRTPLAGLRSTLEVSLSRERDSDTYRKAMNRCLAICTGVQTVVESLLALARSEATPASADTEAISVAGMLRECWSVWDQKARERNLDVQWRVEESLQLQADPAALRIVFENLFGNAVSYANDDGSVAIEASMQDDELCVRITNTGSQIEPQQAEQVFRPFWRGDKARSAVGTHSGLGLALCKRLAERLGGRIAADSVAGGDFSVELRFAGRLTARDSGDAALDHHIAKSC